MGDSQEGQLCKPFFGKRRCLQVPSVLCPVGPWHFLLLGAIQVITSCHKGSTQEASSSGLGGQGLRIPRLSGGLGGREAPH